MQAKRTMWNAKKTYSEIKRKPTVKYKQNLQKNTKKTYCEIQTKHANKYREILLSNKQKTEMQTKLTVKY